MNIELNGKKVEVPQGITVQALVESYQLSPKTILVERNSLALHRSEWSMALEPNDQIEFIKVVAGG